MFELRVTADSGWISLRAPNESCNFIVPDKVRASAELRPPRIENIDVMLVGADDRQYVGELSKTTLDTPLRWICKLQGCYRDPGVDLLQIFEATGVLIAPQYVLTAGHNLLHRVHDDDGRFIEAVDPEAIVVIPALDGAKTRPQERMPFGWTRGEAVRTNALYRENIKRGFHPHSQDYGLIRLVKPIGQLTFPVLGNRVLGSWGDARHGDHTLIKAREPRLLTGVRVNVMGYPADKCRDQPRGRSVTQEEMDTCSYASWASTQWLSFDRVLDGQLPDNFAEMGLAHDIASGMSGSPVWLRWKGLRNLVGIAHLTDQAHNRAVRITNELLTDIHGWM